MLQHKGWRCPAGSDDGKNLTLEELSEIFHSIESTENKILKADPNLEKQTWHFLLERGTKHRKDAPSIL